MKVFIQNRTARLVALFFLLTGLIWVFAGPAHAQTQQLHRGPDQVNRQVAADTDADAERVSEQFTEILGKYSPALGQILRLDPSLMGREDYMAAYPAVVAFLGQHPEIKRNPSYYLRRYSTDYYYNDPRSRAWQSMFEMFGVFVIVLTIVAALGWMVKTAINYRRWGRLTKVQTEAHTKLLDRFTGNEDLLAYVKSPAGAKFLESAPIMLDGGPRMMGAPLNRILWSMQAGVVLAACGIGMNYVSRRVDPYSQDPIFAVSVILLSLGLGFFASAALSFVLSRRLGLIDPETQSAPRP
ncbi:MAG TPA: hypothetical protein VMS54_00510 [Vicinamibacterales bacterium]|nr:hypothetical protein [Vicinamibacterales bacterium]